MMTNELLTIKAGGLTIKADLTATGWNLPEKLTEMEWRNAGCFLVTIDQARQWWLGDWWNACKWGDGKYFVCRRYPPPYPTIDLENDFCGEWQHKETKNAKKHLANNNGAGMLLA